LESLLKHIAYISQDIFLFSDTIYNNLRMGDESISNERIQEVCRMCHADEFIENLPMKYDTMLDENGNNLSGGQKQRLAIARAMLRKPNLLIMDEATSNLDTITEKGIKKTMDEICENMTCIIIAHRLKTIKNCDYIYVMDKGKIAEEGTHEELIKKAGIYSRYWDD
jgi:ABC-type multidrug transport system fused ATPase/permease subunit